jgi:hypothetical protein
MPMWNVEIGDYPRADVPPDNGGKYVDLRIGDSCVQFSSAREVQDFIQQLPAIGAQLKAASKDAFDRLGTISEGPADEPSRRAD